MRKRNKQVRTALKCNRWDPMGWPEIIYETIGPKYPTASLVAAALVGVVLFGGGWYCLGRHYQSERHPKTETVSQEPAAQGQPVIPREEEPTRKPTSSGESHQPRPQIRQKSSGPNSPNIVTGDHGSVNIKQE